MERKPISYSDFIELVYDTECAEAQIFINQWRALTTKENWRENGSTPLTLSLLMGFAEDMATLFRRAIHGASKQDIAEIMTKDGHEFLLEIHAKAAELGFEVPPELINVPLIPEEVMAEIAKN